MKPTAGQYRLRFHEVDGQGNAIGQEYEVTYTVTATDTMPTPWGTMVWEPEGDCFRRDAIAIRCTGTGTFEAVNGDKSYLGTCELA